MAIALDIVEIWRALEKEEIQVFKPRKRLDLKVLFNLQVHMHPIVGARLHLAHKTRPFVNEDGKKFIHPFFIFWRMPDRKGVNEYQIFETPEEARNAFERVKAHGIVPARKEFSRDYQEDKVIAFNDKVMKGAGRYTLPQMKKLVGQISAEFRMAIMDIDYVPGTDGDVNWAQAFTEIDFILMRTKNLAITLHEMAHMLDKHICRAEWADHGPSFMRAYMVLLERYMHFPELGLEEMCRKLDIDVAALDELPRLRELKDGLNIVPV